MVGRTKKKFLIIFLPTSLKWPYFLQAIFFRSFLQKKIFELGLSKFFLFNFFLNIFFHQFIESNHFALAIARIRMRTFQLKSGEKYRMLHERKVSDYQRV